MRRFIVNKGTKLILNKQDPLDIDKLYCPRLFNFDSENKSIKILYTGTEHQKFTRVEVKEYNSTEEFVCYAFLTTINSDNTESDIGLTVKIPHTRDRIIVEPCVDFDPCDAVEIIEED